MVECYKGRAEHTEFKPSEIIKGRYGKVTRWVWKEMELLGRKMGLVSFLCGRQIETDREKQTEARL